MAVQNRDRQSGQSRPVLEPWLLAGAPRRWGESGAGARPGEEFLLYPKCEVLDSVRPFRALFSDFPWTTPAGRGLSPPLRAGAVLPRRGPDGCVRCPHADAWRFRTATVRERIGTANPGAALSGTEPGRPASRPGGREISDADLRRRSGGRVPFDRAMRGARFRVSLSSPWPYAA